MFARFRLIPALLACALLAACGSAVADQPASTVHKSLTTTQAVPAGTTVKVENLVGHVEVQQGGSQLTVAATVVAGGADHAAAQTLADSVRLTVSHADGNLIVHVHYPVDRHDTYRYIPEPGTSHRNNSAEFLGFTFHGSSSSTGIKYQGQRVSVYRGRDRGVPLHVDLVVKLPANSRADIRNHVGPIGATNLHASLDLHSDSGDIHARHVNGKLVIHSDSGDSTIVDTRGTLVVNSDSGDVTVRRINGNTTVNADSGDVAVATAHGGDLTVHADSGDIRVDDVSGTLQLDADSGDIRLKNLGRVPHLDASADSGDIHVHGDLRGLGSFKLETDSGDVVMRTAHPPAVHLVIDAEDISVNWPSVHDVRKSENRFTGDVGNATGQGRIETDNGDVVLTQ